MNPFEVGDIVIMVRGSLEPLRVEDSVKYLAIVHEIDGNHVHIHKIKNNSMGIWDHRNLTLRQRFEDVHLYERIKVAETTLALQGYPIEPSYE